MISKEEFAILQQKFIQQSQEKDKLLKQVNEMYTQNAKIQQLQQQIIDLRAENEKEDMAQMQELGVASTELNNLRQEIQNVKNSGESKKNQKLMVQLDSLHDKKLKLDKDLADLEKQDQDLYEQEEPLDKEIEECQRFVDTFHPYCERLTNGRDYILEIIDAEGQINQLQTLIDAVSGVIPDLESKVNSLEAEKECKTSEMRRITADIDTVTEQIKAGDLEHTQKYKMLNKASIQLHEVNEQTKTERAKIEDIQLRYVRKTQDIVAEGKKIQQKIDEIQKRTYDFPEYKKAALVDLKTKVNKAKQLTDQLEAKRKELRTQIQQNMLSSDIIVNLNKAMEEEWYQRQALLDEENELSYQFYKYSESLERKKLVAEELERLYPHNATPIKGCGLPEFEYIYTQMISLNGKLEEVLDELKEEYEIHRNDNHLLREFYETTSK